MFNKIIGSLFGSRNERLIKQMRKDVLKVNVLEPQIQALSNEALQAKTPELRQRLKDGASIDSVLPEAFAVCREAALRILSMRHFDVQLIGGMVLNEGKIAEMRTGEGKTLMATLPAYLNALTGNSVHIVTVNDYLAGRDANWMKPLYEFLGLTVGIIYANQPHEDKKAAYTADIVYGTNNEFGFDYLRDNMAFTLDQKVQRDLTFAIIDEVDSILIDEARTPLIISGAAEESSEMYRNIDKLVHKLKRKAVGDVDTVADYEVDEKTKQAHLTEEGHSKLESLLADAGLLKEGKSLYDLANISLMHHVSAALRANACFHRDVDYIVKNDEVVIVDEHTGRTMQGRRWSDGLHQAIEAKEGAKIQSENVTLASITFQNYFRLYTKLSGMTGTADTEAYEFQQIYGLEVVVIPTNRDMIRKDMPDQVYLTTREKFEAVIEDIKTCREREQPVLVGTASIEASEHLAKLLEKANIAHQVLNAKFHEKEAEIIAQAGRPGAVTIATNMAGRGTDIILGGNAEVEIAKLENSPENSNDEKINALRAEWKINHDKVIAAGGLHIIGSERHESRRIDNQLRGRSGRQGDPGSSRFYLSLEDTLMRIFASDRMAGLMKRLGMKEGESIEHPWINKAVENAQRKVEGHNFDIRKQLLEYDDVANDQRRVVYAQRNALLETSDISEMIKKIQLDAVDNMMNIYVPAESLEEQWNIDGLTSQLRDEFGTMLPIKQWLESDDSLHADTLRQRIHKAIADDYTQKEAQITAPVLREFEKTIMLQSFDYHWREHLSAMDHLRQGIGWRGYAQKNPKQEYKREAFAMFNEMLDKVKHQVAGTLSQARFVSKEDVEAMEAAEKKRVADQTMTLQHKEENNFKAGRNDPCPCGSGKKYKQCHGKIGG